MEGLASESEPCWVSWPLEEPWDGDTLRSCQDTGGIKMVMGSAVFILDKDKVAKNQTKTVQGEMCLYRGVVTYLYFTGLSQACKSQVWRPSSVFTHVILLALSGARPATREAGHNTWLAPCTLSLLGKKAQVQEHCPSISCPPGNRIQDFPAVSQAYWPLPANQYLLQMSLELRWHLFGCSWNLTPTHLWQVEHNQTDDQYQFTAGRTGAWIKGDCLSISTPPKNHTWDHSALRHVW